MNTLKRLAYFIRWGHWPKRMRYPNGIPRVVSEELGVSGQVDKDTITLSSGSRTKTLPSDASVDEINEAVAELSIAKKVHLLALMVESGEISYEEMHRRLGVPYPVMEDEPLTESDWLGNGSSSA